MLAHEIAFFDEHKTGDLTNRLSSDTTRMQDAATTNLSMLLELLPVVKSHQTKLSKLQVPLLLGLWSLCPTRIELSRAWMALPCLHAWGL